MTGYVFPPLAKAPDASAFLGFKHLWDMLFQLGTIAYGIGVAVARLAPTACRQIL